MIVLGIDVGKVQSWCKLDVDGSSRIYKNHGDILNREDALAVLRGSDLICIEEPSTIMPSRRLESAGHRVAIGIGNGLLRAMKQMRDLELLAAGLGIPVVLISSTAARRAIGIRISAGKVDAQIGRAVPMIVGGWPKRSNNHTRDAAVVAVSGYAKWRATGGRTKRGL